MWVTMKFNKIHIVTALMLTFILCNGDAFAKPTTVDDTLRFAFEYAPNIKAAQESRQQSLHNVRAAEAGYYPTIGIWAGFGIENNDNVSTRLEHASHEVINSLNMGISASQTLWQGGNTSSNVRMRNEEVIYRAWLIMDSSNSLAYSAISAHADVIRRRVLVKLAKENVAENYRILGMLRTRFEQGLSSEGDVDLTLGRVGRAEATLSLHQQALETAYATYTKVTGQPVPLEMTQISMPKRIYSNTDEIREVSLDKNIRIQTDLAAIRNALAEKDVAKSNFSPRVSLDVSNSYSNQAYEGTNYQTNWSAMLNMSWEIYSGGRDVATVQGVAAKVRELRHRLHESMDLVNQEIMITYSLTKRTDEQAKLYAKAANAAQRAKANYTAQFEVGQKDLLSVLDAEGEYYFGVTESEIRKIDAILGYYRLLAISGELLTEAGIKHADLIIETGEDEPSMIPWSFKPSTLDTREALEGTTLTK